MEEMNEHFIPEVNAFIEILKEANHIHVKHLVKLSDFQKKLLQENRKLILQWQLEDKPKLVNEADFLKFIETQKSYCKDFELQAKAFRTIFQNHIDDSNFILGKFSNHWGGYIESVGVLYLLNHLRKEYGVHTFIEKFKRYWHKSRNVEIDLLALSTTHVYIVEAKHNFKAESIGQMHAIIQKFKEQVQEYDHLIIQPIVFYIHSTDQIIEQAKNENFWLLRYKNFDRDKPQNTFEWLNPVLENDTNVAD